VIEDIRHVERISPLSGAAYLDGVFRHPPALAARKRNTDRRTRHSCQCLPVGSLVRNRSGRAGSHGRVFAFPEERAARTALAT
jgi:hypothetical protein